MPKLYPRNLDLPVRGSVQYIVIEQPVCRCKCADQRAEISIFDALHNSTVDDPLQVHGEGSASPDFHAKEEVHEHNQQQQYTDVSQTDLDESDCELCLTCLQPLSDYCLDFHKHGFVPLPDPDTCMALRIIPERASFFVGSGPGPWAGKLASENSNVLGDASSACSDCAKKDFDEPVRHQLYLDGYQNDMCDGGDLKILNGQATAYSEYFTRDESDCEICLTCLQPLSDYCLDFHKNGYVPLPDPDTCMAERIMPEHASFFIGSGPGPWAGKLVSENTNVHFYRSLVPEETNVVHGQVMPANADSRNDMEVQSANKTWMMFWICFVASVLDCGCFLGKSCNIAHGSVRRKTALVQMQSIPDLCRNGAGCIACANICIFGWIGKIQNSFCNIKTCGILQFFVRYTQYMG